MSGAADFRVEIIKARPQSIVSPSLGAPVAGDVIDVTAHVELDGLGSVNRAMERDLLSFKTGDVTLTFDNPAGFFDDLFAFLGATGVWGLRIYRRGQVQFYGCLIGLGSINFNVKDRQVEVTAYGLTKLLDLTAGENVKRTVAAMTVTTAAAGATTITLNSTAGLLTGDVLHVTDHTKSEDLTVKQVTSATVCSLEAAIIGAGGYAAGSPVVLSTPYYRNKTIAWLVTALFTEAGIGIADMRLSNSQFNKLAPAPVNLEGLSLANNARRGVTQYTGRWNVGIHGVDDYGQDEPDDAWVVQGFVDRGIYDHSPYFPQGYDFVGLLGSAYPGEPQPIVFEPVAGTTIEVGVSQKFATSWGAIDYKSSPTKRIWGIENGAANSYLIQNTTIDGVTWGGVTQFLIAAATTSTLESGCEYDPVRDIVYTVWKQVASTTRFFQYRDLGGAAWVDCKQAGDAATTGYYGPRYIADKDYTIVLKNTTGVSTGPAFTICAFRGATLLWERPFPSCLVVQEHGGCSAFFPTRTARYVNGSIYLVLVSDGAVQLLRTDDEFQTYTMRKLCEGTSETVAMCARVNDTYRIACYKGTAPRGYFVAAPFYAGVVEYADHEGLSDGEGIKKQSVLANALFWVDDDAQGHFVARDLYDPGAVLDITDRIMERSDSILWDQTAQYVTVSGNGHEATAGDHAFAADGIELESALIPNEAFAQALADAMYAFYSAARRYLEVTVLDTDGHIYYPLDRVIIDGLRYLVYESDHDLVADEVTLTLLEDR